MKIFPAGLFCFSVRDRKAADLSKGVHMRYWIVLVRIPCTIILGFLLTLFWGSAIYLFVVPAGIICWIFSLDNPVRDFPGHWFRGMHWVTRVGLNLGETTMADVADSQETVLVVSNHPPSIALPYLMRFIASTIRKRPNVFSKFGNAYILPIAVFVAWPAWMAGAFTFLFYRDRERAKRQIMRAVQRVMRRRGIIVLFWDQHRPTLAQIDRDRDDFAGKVPGATDYTQVGIARYGGAYGALQAANWQIRCVDVTFAFHADGNGFGGPWRVYGSEVMMDAEEVPIDDIPRDLEGFRAWVNERQWRKQLLITAFRREKKQRAG